MEAIAELLSMDLGSVTLAYKFADIRSYFKERTPRSMGPPSFQIYSSHLQILLARSTGRSSISNTLNSGVNFEAHGCLALRPLSM